MSILVTGGLGYIGSHCVIELLENSSNKISNKLNIKNYFKYTQLWIINNYKKLTNNRQIINQYYFNNVEYKVIQHDRYFCNNSKHNLSKCIII